MRRKRKEAEPLNLEGVIPGFESLLYVPKESRLKWQRENKVEYDFNSGNSSSEVVIRSLPSRETISKSNLEKLESIFREAREKGDLNVCLKAVDLMQKIGLTFDTTDSNEIIISL